MSVSGQMFGIAGSAAYIRAGGSGTLTRQILASLAKGFGGNTGDGAYVHDLFAAQSGFTVSGFDGASSYTTSLENNVSGLSGPYKIGVGAIIFSYLNLPNVNETDVLGFINRYCATLNSFVSSPYVTYTKDALEYTVSHASLPTINAQLSGIPKNSTNKAINYNWYDASALFVNPDFNVMADLIKDTECQYYYVSGEMVYNQLPSKVNNCNSYYIQVNTPTGQIPVKVYQNSPCVDSYIGPVSGVKFLRFFSDGPYTSGYFTPQILEEYYNFDKAILSPNDYSSNVASLYSTRKQADGSYVLVTNGARIDNAGYVQSGREYGFGHTNFTIEECPDHPAWPLQSMHQGDKRTKLWLHSFSSGPPDNICLQDTGYYNWTGWKLAVFKLDDSYAKSFSDIRLNPNNATGGILVRALNLNTVPYANAMDTGDGLLTVGDLGPYGGPVYVGPPQLNGSSSLPGFAFYQSFENNNFPSGGTGFSFVLRPMVTIDDTDFSVSNYDVVSGSDPTIHHVSSPTKARVAFNTVVRSNDTAGKDDVFQKCFGMGDGFNNSVTTFSGLQSNAGFFYTGYSYYISGQLVPLGDLLNNSIVVVGNAYPQTKYPYGYRSGSHILQTNNQHGFIETGDTSTGVFTQGPVVKYDYFADGVFGAINSGWNGAFAPAPQDIIDNYYNLTTQYTSQPTENYLPRYKQGPYLTYDTIFLYPNADQQAKTYESNVNGFPANVEYVITVKEETVREAFKVSGLNGFSLQRHVVRADSNGNPLVLETAMAQPFTPNDLTYTYKYDFTRNKTLYPDEGEFFNSASFNDYFVDENYVPSTSGCPQGQLNTTLHHYGSNNQFNQGIKITGQLVTRKLSGAAGTTKDVTFSEPVDSALYWGYKSKKITGTMKYTPPVFDLSSYTLNPSKALISDMLDNLYGYTHHTNSNNGSIVDGDINEQIGNPYFQYYGKDPIFYEHVNGRSGSGSNVEGGYHSKGLVGDAWYHFNAQIFGNATASCGPFSEYYYRAPENDKYVSIAALTPTGFDLIVRGLYYYPYYLNWQYQPFKTPSIGSIGVAYNATEATKLNYYYEFNLKDTFYPPKSGIQNGIYSGLYSSSGLTIGPFDRDVELCVTGKGGGIYPKGAWIIDDLVISQENAITCPHPITDIDLNSGIETGKHGRNGCVSTFKLIPSGHTANINFSGTGIVGVTGNAFVTIRPRTCIGGVNVFGTDAWGTISGDVGYLDGLRYINNGSENDFHFPVVGHDFSSLVGKKLSFTTVANQQVLYPQPSASDFDIVLKPTLDANGNKIYKANPTKVYWTDRNFNGTYSGFREVTRLYISVDSIKINMDEIPYQTFKTIIPTGQCNISGVFQYTGEAEAAIVSDGIVLTGVSGASSLNQIFQPVYVSDVMQRLPVNIYKLPTGNGSYQPVLLAPSYMKQRENAFTFTGGDKYIPVTPDTNKHYNAFLWPAWSDLALLNPEVVYEAMPPYDGNVYPDSYLTFSAAQGQKIGTGFNLSEDVTYAVAAQYGFIDSVATNPIYNTGKCIFSGNAGKSILHSGDLSGILTAEGANLTMALSLNNYKK